MPYKYFPIEFSSYEDYVKYLKEKGFAIEVPEGINSKNQINYDTRRKSKSL